MKLSIIIPVYNEEKTLTEIVDKVEKVKLISKVQKEVIIVNDSSTDNSQKVIEKLKNKYKNIRSFNHPINKGKGAAIRTAIKHVSGDVVVAQDGDLEYNPEDFNKMLPLIIENKADVVYGSRLLGNISGFNIPSHYYGNLLLSFITRLLYAKKITDMETCYKMMKSSIIKNLNLKSNTFDIEPEVTSKILKKGFRVKEVPISYNCRSFEQGKKITWKDGILAIFTLFRYRLSN
jgi:dolichol-phosphate mannosyltransferase